MNKDSFNVYRKEFPLIYLFLGVFSKFFIYQDLFLLFQLIYKLINFNWFENIYYHFEHITSKAGDVEVDRIWM